MLDDLKIIKKKYGEEMMHFCRDTFATILEEPGVLSNLLLTYFEPSKELFSDLQKENLENDFKSFIYRKFNKEEQVTITETKTPQELLASVGYDLYECKNEEDIQKFKKYYAKGEKLCTFNGGRLNQCHVFFAVKKDVDNIKREDFNHPKRQDLYGTSVISIQFDKNEAHTLSIKNRYNHTVKNPDATFSNNLDYIVEGLTYSFALHYDLKQKHVNEFEIPSYERDNNGKYYKYNFEMNGVHYCTNNCILVEHEAIKFPKERYILADYFIIDRQEKTIECYDKSFNECFPEFFQDNPIKKIDLEIEDNTKIVKIETSKGIVTLELDKENKIIGLTNPYIEEIGDYFLYYGRNLEEIDLTNVKKIGNYFLTFNENLKKINLLNVENIGTYFLYYNKSLSKIDLPKIKILGPYFLAMNTCLKDIYMPNVENIGPYFLPDNESLIKINLPKVKEIQSHFLYHNAILEELNLPLIIKIGSSFLRNNKCLKKIYMPNVIQIGQYFLPENQCLEEVIIDNESIYQDFLWQHPEYKKNELTRKLTKWRRG